MQKDGTRFFFSAGADTIRDREITNALQVGIVLSDGFSVTLRRGDRSFHPCVRISADSAIGITPSASNSANVFAVGGFRPVRDLESWSETEDREKAVAALAELRARLWAPPKTFKTAASRNQWLAELRRLTKDIANVL